MFTYKNYIDLDEKLMVSKIFSFITSNLNFDKSSIFIKRNMDIENIKCKFNIDIKIYNETDYNIFKQNELNKNININLNYEELIINIIKTSNEFELEFEFEMHNNSNLLVFDH